jgi:hypothetical protein
VKKMIVNVGVGVALFAGTMVASLIATGRFDREGVAGIPGLGSLFPAPAGSGDGADAGKVVPQAKDADAARSGPAAKEAGLQAEAQDPERQTLRRGRSIFDGGAPPEGAHGEEAKPAGGSRHESGAGAEPADHAPSEPQHAPAAQDPRTQQATGGYFRFDGMPSGITPEQFNEAWRRVQQATAELETRQRAIDLREQELRALADDIARRQTEIGKERAEVEALQLKLDDRIQRFQDQVKLVRADEAGSLKRNAETLASFEPQKAAELVETQWKTDAGQDEVLRTFEFMDKEAVNAILAALPNALVQDLLQKRLKVVRERAAPAGR